MGYLACPVCERESLADVSDLQQRVAAALNRPLSCPICSASVSGIQAFHHHLAAHLPVLHKAPFLDASPSTTTCSTVGIPPYPISGSPEGGIPTLEHLEINDSKGSPRSPSGPHRMLGMDGISESTIGLSTQPEPLSPSHSSVPNLSSSNKVTQPHNCDLCGLIFSSEYFLKFHKDIIHSKREFFDVTCKLCKEKFKDFEAYRNHVRENHSDRRYICDQCPKTFKMKGSLLVHMRMFHDPSSPGTCQLCKKTFTTKARKELHEKRYHGVGLEHIPTGKISPPSPQKQQKTKNSSLGDAKSWLETLMVETSPAEEHNNRYKEFQGQQNQQPLQSLPQQTLPEYSPPKAQNHHDQMNSPEIQIGNQFVNHLPPQQQLEPKEDKGTRDIHTQLSQDPQHLQKSQRPEPDSQQLQKWTTEFQPYINSQEKVDLPKHSPEMYYQQQKISINLPGHTSQQIHEQSRSRADYGDFKQEKKFPVLPHGGESSSCRPVGVNYVQQSPVAIVSPQPQKSETPPADNQSNGGSSAPYHNEVRRNSFPMMNFNKTGMSQTETPRLHPPSYISELSLTTSAPIPIPTSQNICVSNLGDKIQNSLAMSQHLIYQHNQNLIPSLNQTMTLTGPDSKVGVKVPPQLISSSVNNMMPLEKVKEPPDSPIQMMQLQKEPCPSEMACEGDRNTEKEKVPEVSQEHCPETGKIRRQGAVGILTTAPTTTVIRKENTGKTDSKQWECDICKKSFTTKYFLKKHKRLHTGETPYACAECGKTFTFQQSYHKHILYHSDDKPHQCSYCGRAFKEMSTLHNHVRIHTGEKPFVCENCGKAFRQRVSYLVHQRIHTGVMPYTCEACGRSFRYKVSLRSHKCEPTVVSPSVAVASTTTATTATTTTTTRSTDRIGEVIGPSGNPASASPSSSLSSAPPSATNPVILLPQSGGTAASALVGVVTSTSSSKKTEEPATGNSPVQQMAPSTSSNNARENEASFLSSNRHHQPHSHQRQKLHLLHQQQLQQQDMPKHRQESSNATNGQSKAALETIDLSAISCDGMRVPPEGKKSTSKSSRGPSQCVSPRSAGGVTGVLDGYQDPLSVAFLHALVDPQQGPRFQGDCRPPPQLPSQEGLPFPSLCPGSIDTDLDHDSFLTNLLM